MEGSNKLKISYVKKMFEVGLTSKEIDFIMYLALSQDHTGLVRGVYYKTVSEAIDVSYPEFYQIIRDLSEKQMIIAEKKHRIDWDVQLVDNKFDYPEAYAEGYVKISAMFTQESFRRLKAGSKMLALEFMRLSAASRASVRISKTRLYEKYCDMLHVQRRMIRTYIAEIRHFFAVYVKEGIVYITPYRASKERAAGGSETDKCQMSFVKAICRRNHIDSNKDDHAVKSVKSLINQYKARCIECGERIERVMEYSVAASIEMINRNVKKKKAWVRELRPKLIHKIIKNVLKIDTEMNF